MSGIKIEIFKTNGEPYKTPRYVYVEVPTIPPQQPQQIVNINIQQLPITTQRQSKPKTIKLKVVEPEPTKLKVVEPEPIPPIRLGVNTKTRPTFFLPLSYRLTHKKPCQQMDKKLDDSHLSEDMQMQLEWLYKNKPYSYYVQIYNTIPK
jgi:hypothetical protein